MDYLFSNILVSKWLIPIGTLLFMGVYWLGYYLSFRLLEVTNTFRGLRAMYPLFYYYKMINKYKVIKNPSITRYALLNLFGIVIWSVSLVVRTTYLVFITLVILTSVLVYLLATNIIRIILSLVIEIDNSKLIYSGELYTFKVDIDWYRLKISKKDTQVNQDKEKEIEKETKELEELNKILDEDLSSDSSNNKDEDTEDLDDTEITDEELSVLTELINRDENASKPKKEEVVEHRKKPLLAKNIKLAKKKRGK